MGRKRNRKLEMLKNVTRRVNGGWRSKRESNLTFARRRLKVDESESITRAVNHLSRLWVWKGNWARDFLQAEIGIWHLIPQRSLVCKASDSKVFPCQETWCPIKSQRQSLARSPIQMWSLSLFSPLSSLETFSNSRDLWDSPQRSCHQSQKPSIIPFHKFEKSDSNGENAARIWIQTSEGERVERSEVSVTAASEENSENFQRENDKLPFTLRFLRVA